MTARPGVLAPSACPPCTPSPRPAPNAGEDFREFNPLPSWVPFPVARFAVKRFAALTKAWYAWERKRGGGGTCRGNAPLYASVERLLAEQKK